MLQQFKYITAPHIKPYWGSTIMTIFLPSYKYHTTILLKSGKSPTEISVSHHWHVTNLHVHPLWVQDQYGQDVSSQTEDCQQWHEEALGKYRWQLATGKWQLCTVGCQLATLKKHSSLREAMKTLKLKNGYFLIKRFLGTFCAPTILEFWLEKREGLTKSKVFGSFSS